MTYTSTHTAAFSYKYYYASSSGGCISITGISWSAKMLRMWLKKHMKASIEASMLTILYHKMSARRTQMSTSHPTIPERWNIMSGACKFVPAMDARTWQVIEATKRGMAGVDRKGLVSGSLYLIWTEPNSKVNTKAYKPLRFILKLRNKYNCLLFRERTRLGGIKKKELIGDLDCEDSGWRENLFIRRSLPSYYVQAPVYSCVWHVSVYSCVWHVSVYMCGSVCIYAIALMQ